MLTARGRAGSLSFAGPLVGPLVGLVVGLLGASVLAGCARPVPRAGDGPPSSTPSGQAQLAASYQVGGGFVPYGWSLMEGPRLVVYSDGVAVADASSTLTLAPDELSELLQALDRDLAGLGPTATAGAESQIADAPTTTLRVRTGPDMYSVAAYALGESTGYPKRLVGARDRMEALAKRVLSDGAPYVGERVRVVLEPRDSAEGTVQPWPATVTLPPPAGDGMGARKADLTGEEAAAAAAALPDTWRDGPWPVMRTSDGKLYGVAWRYLTPGE